MNPYCKSLVSEPMLNSVMSHFYVFISLILHLLRHIINIINLANNFLTKGLRAKESNDQLLLETALLNPQRTTGETGFTTQYGDISANALDYSSNFQKNRISRGDCWNQREKKTCKVKAVCVVEMLLWKTVCTALGVVQLM